MQLTTRNGFAPTTFTEAKQFADELASSNLVPKQYVGKPLDVLVAMQWGAELGLAPMQALQNIAVINGKPSIYGDAMMALVQASPVCEDMQEYFEGEGTANPVAVCVAARKGRKPVVAKFSVEDAKRAGLWGKQGPWTAYPKRMLQMRARGFALRDAFPDVLKGLITIEEAQDYPAEAAPKEIKIPANPLDAIAPPAPPEILEIPLSGPLPVEVVEVELQNVPAESAEPVAESYVPDLAEAPWPVYKPGATDNDKPILHVECANALEWITLYEDMADQMVRFEKMPARDRMTRLRMFKDVNKGMLDRLPQLERLPLNQKYQKRLNSLGAALK